MEKQKKSEMTLNQLAGYLHMDANVMIDGLKAIKVINQNGTPRKKYVDDGYFYDDCTVADYAGLKNLLIEKLGIKI